MINLNEKNRIIRIQDLKEKLDDEIRIDSSVKKKVKI